MEYINATDVLARISKRIVGIDKYKIKLQRKNERFFTAFIVVQDKIDPLLVMAGIQPKSSNIKLFDIYVGKKLKEIREIFEKACINLNIQLEIYE